MMVGLLINDVIREGMGMSLTNPWKNRATRVRTGSICVEMESLKKY